MDVKEVIGWLRGLPAFDRLRALEEINEAFERVCVRCDRVFCNPHFYAPVKTPDFEGELCEECYEESLNWFRKGKEGR